MDEKNDIGGYHGREILELLQNADDAYQKSIDLGEKPACELQVTISYKAGILSVSNTGTSFDEDGILAIVQGNNSPKRGRYIGNKGTGFRSVLNWTSRVRIYSGEYAVEFSEEIAGTVFEEIKDCPQIQKQIQKNKNLYLPMLAVPQNIADGELQTAGYAEAQTTVEVTIDPEKMKEDDYPVDRQISEIDLRILLFLPNISQIRVETEEKTVVYKRVIKTEACKEIDGSKYVVLTKNTDGESVQEEAFYLFEKDIPDEIWEENENEKKLVKLSVAVKPEVTNS